MPKKPKRSCSYPDCPSLTDGRYCEKHEKLTNKQYEHYGRKYRKNERYGTTWRKVRDLYIKAHHFCEECFCKHGILKPAEHVHHIKPLEKGGTNEADNLMSLCKSCHSKLHAKRGDRWSKIKEYKY